MENYDVRLVAPGYELFLYAVPPLCRKFLESRWSAGMSAASAARLLADHGYVAPADVKDILRGRVLGHQSTLRNQGFLSW